MENEILKEKKVRVVPITRDSSPLPKGHDGHFMYTGCKASYCVPIDVKKGQLVNPLTREEQAFFETELALKPGELSIHRKKKENYWNKFNVLLDKDGLILDLMDPIDYIRWKVLQVHPSIANSWEERNNSAEYRFAMVDGEHELEEKVRAGDKKKKAYRIYEQLEASREKMYDFLKVYGKRPAENATQTFLSAEIDKIIEDDIDGFLRIAGDVDFEKKLFISQCIDANIMVKERTKYKLPGGDLLGNTLDETVEFLREKKNSEVYASLKAGLKAHKQ